MAMMTARMIEVCIFTINNNEPMYLLLRRSDKERIYPGIWQFVTGSIEKGEKASNAALRELAEETGMKPKAFWVVPYINSFYDPGWDSVNLMPVFAAEVEPDKKPVLSAEHEEFEWLPFEKALERLVWPGQKEGMKIVHEYIVKGKQAAALRRLI